MLPNRKLTGLQILTFLSKLLNKYLRRVLVSCVILSCIRTKSEELVTVSYLAALGSALQGT
jgi:hypothetical protein